MTDVTKYLSDPKIAHQKDRVLALAVQLLATSQGQVMSAYWNTLHRTALPHDLEQDAKEDKAATGYAQSAKHGLLEVIALLDTI